MCPLLFQLQAIKSLLLLTRMNSPKPSITLHWFIPTVLMFTTFKLHLLICWRHEGLLGHCFFCLNYRWCRTEACFSHTVLQLMASLPVTYCSLRYAKCHFQYGLRPGLMRLTQDRWEMSIWCMVFIHSLSTHGQCVRNGLLSKNPEWLYRCTWCPKCLDPLFQAFFLIWNSGGNILSNQFWYLKEKETFLNIFALGV